MSDSFKLPNQTDSINQLERDKWNAFYLERTEEPEDETMTAFCNRLAQQIGIFLPTGAKILEIGCGAGWQSLSLARLGRFDVHLMDFAPAALTSATAIFSRAGQQASFHLGDAFQPAESEYDLVFNAGALEHYNFDQQIGFLQGMASRSKRYVLVLTPNNLSYWYWIWRIRAAAAGKWPYGIEVPVSDMSKVFKAAGLKFCGDTFIGEEWTEIHINALGGIDKSFRDDVLSAHRSPAVPFEQKSYLYAALGTVDGSVNLPPGALFRRRARVQQAVKPIDQTIIAEMLSERIAGMAREDALRARYQSELLQAERRRKDTEAELENLRHTIEKYESVLSGYRQRLLEEKREAQDSCRQLDKRLLKAREDVAESRENLSTYMRSQDASISQRRSELTATRAAVGAADDLVLRSMRIATTLAEVARKISASRSYKIGYILWALKRSPWRGSKAALKWLVGGFRTQGIGLAGALAAPDPIRDLFLALKATLRHADGFKSQAPADLLDPNSLPQAPIPTRLSRRATANKATIACLVKDFKEGGLERVVMDLCYSLGKLGYTPHILVAGEPGRCLEEATRLGIRVEVVGDNRRKFDAYLATSSPKVVISHHCSDFAQAINASGIPLLEVIHNVYFWHREQTDWAKMRQEYVSHFIAVSNSVADFSVRCLGISRSRIVVVPNGLNPFGLIRPPLALLSSKRLARTSSPRFLHLATINPQKNPRLVLRAFGYLVKEFPQAQLSLCGGATAHPELSNALRREITAEGLAENVECTGAQDRRSVSRQLCEAHIGLLPSFYEGYSITSLEYSYFGLPCVLSDTGAAKELLARYGHGKIVSNCAIPAAELSGSLVEEACWGDPEDKARELASLMSTMVQDYRRWSEAALRAAEKSDEYMMGPVCAKYNEVIKRYL